MTWVYRKSRHCVEAGVPVPISMVVHLIDWTETEIFKKTARKFLQTLPLLLLPQSGIPDVVENLGIPCQEK